MQLTKQKGFTLVEVLVALVILAIALLAIVRATDTNIRNLDYLRDKMQAQWVADNLLSNIQAGLMPTPRETSQQGQVVMLNHTWYWAVSPQQSGNKAIQRVSISVAAKPDGKPMAILIGFVRN